MKRLWLLVVCGVFLATLFALKAEARPQYRYIIDAMDAQTPAEAKVQALVKEEKCNACHDKKSKKIRNEMGQKLHTALGGGDKANYKYDSKMWRKSGGEYSDAAIKTLRDALNEAFKED